MCQQFLSVELVQVCLLNSGIFDSLPILSNGYLTNISNPTLSNSNRFLHHRPHLIKNFIFSISQAKSWRVMLDSLSHIFPCHLVDCNILSWSLLPLLLPTVDSPHKSRGILWKCTDPVTSHGSHRIQSKGQWLLRFIKPYAIWPPPHSHFHLTVVSAHISTVLIYFIYLGIQGTLQTCQIPVRGFLPQECFPPGIPSPQISARPIQTFTSGFSSGVTLSQGLPRLSYFHSLCPTLPVSLALGLRRQWWTWESILSLLWGEELSK